MYVVFDVFVIEFLFVDYLYWIYLCVVFFVYLFNVGSGIFKCGDELFLENLL